MQAPGQVQQGSCVPGLGSFGAVRGHVEQGCGEGLGEGRRRRPGRLWCRARSGSTGFPKNLEGFGAKPCQVQQGSVPKIVLEKVLGGFDAEPGQCQVPQWSGEGFRCFCAEPGQVRQGSGDGSGEGLGGFGAEPGQVQQGSAEGSGEGSRRLWCRARSGSTVVRRRSQMLWCSHGQVQQCFGEGSGEGVGSFGAEPG